MSRNLEVSFNSPQCGWMSIGFDDGVSEFHTTTAHAPHSFALAGLMQILTALIDRSSPENDYTLKWNRDPEEYDFRFVSSGADVRIEIYQYPTDKREPAEREMVYGYTGDLREVCRAFAATFDQLYADRDTDEFEFNWRQPFPFREFAAFEDALDRVK
ncbi:hypothetical protein BH20ACI2_BH20ACI2_02010 [soil metagenome]